ncbi:MAG: glycoside hydrolase N-terminal domain-containing protein [Umezawaea sp.]
MRTPHDHRRSLITPPERGLHDTSPAASRSDGFRTGNGEFGAVLHGAPALEKVVFSHHRLVLPDGPLSGQADGRDEPSAGTARSPRRGPTCHPAYEFRISSPGATTVERYGRSTDFHTGEVTSTWTDGYGTWTRRAFASMADRVIAHELLPAPGRTVDTTLSVDTALDGLPGSMSFTTRAAVSNGSGYLNLRGAYPAGRGAFGYEGVTRAVASGGTVFASGATLVVIGATRLLLLTKLDRYESSTSWIFQSLRTALAGLDTDYATLFARHTAVTAA